MPPAAPGAGNKNAVGDVLVSLDQALYGVNRNQGMIYGVKDDGSRIGYFIERDQKARKRTP
jgi:hypothetical protein